MRFVDKAPLIGAAIVLSSASSMLAAQTKLDPAAAAAAFGARERIIDASLSPDGNKVALVTPGPGQATIVQMLDVKTGEVKPINYAKGDPMTLTGCGWASDRRLVCTMYGVTNKGTGPYLAYQRLIALDPDGNSPIALGLKQKRADYISQSDGYVIDWRDGSTDKVLIARNYVPFKGDGTRGGSMAEGLGVDLIDTRTGDVDHVEGASERAVRYWGDGRGNVRLMMVVSMRVPGEFRGTFDILYRQADSRDWKPLGHYDSVAKTGIYPVGVDATTNVAYVLKQNAGRDAVYRVALDGSGREELAFADPRVDVSGIVRAGRSGRIVGATYSTDMPEVKYFDPTYEKLITGLGRALSSSPLVRIVDSSADEKIHLLHASADTDAGRYFLYDGHRKAMTPLGSSRPELAGVPLGAVKPISYAAADGTQIPAYLTLPLGSSGKNLPAIVMPHGGPESRDDWGFDWFAQFFVNRGYAVIQPNYRGSSGYGQDWFKENGFKSWKVAIGDVTDAGRWMVKQGIADPARLAIVGWSYGGYAALQSQVLDPDMFKAVVAVAPVTDLGMLRGEQLGFSNATIARNFIGDGPHIAEGSPARHADAFKAPVILFHGTKDINVATAESRAMDKALRSAGKSSSLTIYPEIDHHLEDNAVRQDMLTKIDAFLTKSLPR
ncbi:dipeptidyl aminopeptidase/acylaminoacyl peptidase [Sphingomonas jinjuensis]|uniref:Dipeptidyl aminopeptidase/acylaminoacyl peptidase n=1 Tax=Sphingomonas jinjuensis TaxID=535907 RepID=A0A840FH43_9SPHN|nr:alpha/beta fold hydrolase [Sphingomonas jinjuensis]MBB4155496.1 dipeptidyl aminopeptidase/acylaminoacyl peptidase [Sphingomonas jinjuensis]